MRILRGVVLSAVLVSLLADNSHAADRPNILLILADDVGTEVLGSYGGETYRTPRLDQLAAGGMRFTHNFSMAVCHPTRICLLTGRYPFRHQHPTWGTFPRNAENNTLAQAMRRAGYATAIAGKWQLALLKDDPDHPHRTGFDEYCLFGWHEGPRYYAPMIYENGRVREDVSDRYGPDVYVDFLIEFMQRKRDHPFFAFYSMALCHDVTDDLARPVPHGPFDRYDNFLEMAEAMDQRVGLLMDALSEMGAEQETLVLFTTDNGSPRSYIHSADDEGQLISKPVVSRQHGKNVPGGKGSLTNAGTNVPLIAHWPGTVPPGSVAHDLVDLTDFYTTFMELAGASPPSDLALDGVSFAGRLRAGTPSRRKWAFAEQGPRAWVRDARWKFYQDGTLFDVAKDPAESRPLPSTTEARETAAARERLQRVFQSLNWSQPPG